MITYILAISLILVIILVALYLVALDIFVDIFANYLYSQLSRREHHHFYNHDARRYVSKMERDGLLSEENIDRVKDLLLDIEIFSYKTKTRSLFELHTIREFLELRNPMVILRYPLFVWLLRKKLKVEMVDYKGKFIIDEFIIETRDKTEEYSLDNIELKYIMSDRDKYRKLFAAKHLETLKDIEEGRIEGVTVEDLKRMHPENLEPFVSYIS
jgi:hypothetical protein